MRKNKLLLLLALLLTAATGAWAQTEELLTTITMSDHMGTIAYSVSGRATLSTSGLVETGKVCPEPEVYGWSNSSPSDIGSVTITAAEGYEITKVVFWDYDMMEGYRNALTDNASPFTCYLKSSQSSLNENMSSASTGNIAKIEVYGYATPAPSTYTVSMKSGVKDADKWTVKVGEGQAQALPVEGLSEGDQVTIQYTGRLKVKGVKATSDAAAAGNSVDLSTLTADYEAQDGDVLTNTLGGNYKITIADGATVTLSDAVIDGTNTSTWAGLTLAGDGTIILSGENTVKGFYEDCPGIFVPANKTLTIQGDGSLTASSNGYGAGIGGGYNISCGNITIEGGTITATGGRNAAGIGGGYSASCGDISITGGTVSATGGQYAPGIGGGGDGGSCGDITITNTVTKVTATAGTYAPNSIGAGFNGTCGTVTIGGTVGAISDSPYTYQPSN